MCVRYNFELFICLRYILFGLSTAEIYTFSRYIYKSGSMWPTSWIMLFLKIAIICDLFACTCESPVCDITMPCYRSYRIFIVAWAMWHVAPPYWCLNHSFRPVIVFAIHPQRNMYRRPKSKILTKQWRDWISCWIQQIWLFTYLFICLFIQN